MYSAGDVQIYSENRHNVEILDKESLIEYWYRCSYAILKCKGSGIVSIRIRYDCATAELDKYILIYNNQVYECSLDNISSLCKTLKLDEIPFGVRDVDGKLRVVDDEWQSFSSL